MPDQPAGKYGCHRCEAKPGEQHHPSCSDYSGYSDKAAYDRGWNDSRCKGLDDAQEDSPAYLAGFRNGVVAREQADNEDPCW